MEQTEVESLWIQLRPHSLPRNIPIILLAVIYHSTASNEVENVTLRDHIQRNTESFLLRSPNALVILTGDFNPTSNGLRSDSICRPNNLKQLIKLYTRDSGILDWFFTNRPNIFDLQRLPKLGSSDHYTVLARPTVTHPSQQHSIQKMQRRQDLASNWREFGSWITTKDWSDVYSSSSCSSKFDLFYQQLSSAIDIFFPWHTVKFHIHDKP